jgi:hypothetical protein
MSTPAFRRCLSGLGLVLLALASSTLAASGGTDHEPRLRVSGGPQVVFDWSRSACSGAEEPDLPARAVRDNTGRVHLFLSHYENYRMSGSGLNDLRSVCRPVLTSPGDPDPSRYRDRRWIASPFTFDGRHVWALVHHEYQGNRHPGRCPEKSYYPCWYNAVTLARSSDGGRSFQQARSPRDLVAASSHRYHHGIGPAGVFAPSNLVKLGKYFYALMRVREPGRHPGDCLFRSTDISAAGSWRAWDGSSFSIRFEDPYRAGPKARSQCKRIAPDEISEMTESLTFSTVLDRYVLIGIAGPRTRKPSGERGVYFSTSEDLIHWSPRKLLMRAGTLHSFECGDGSPIAYPSLIDPTSTARNFETTGRRPFLYFTKFRYRNCSKTPNRDLMRIRISIGAG